MTADKDSNLRVKDTMTGGPASRIAGLSWWRREYGGRAELECFPPVIMSLKRLLDPRTPPSSPSRKVKSVGLQWLSRFSKASQRSVSWARQIGAAA